MHSWRVLLLPYLEERDLYEEYDFAEPWDGPHNRLLEDRMPLAFKCVNDGTFTADYLMVIPDGDAADTGLRDRYMVAESPNSSISWLEPADLPEANLAYGVRNNCSRPTPLVVGANHEVYTVFNVATQTHRRVGAGIIVTGDIQQVDSDFDLKAAFESEKRASHSMSP